jgi:hypothetical protein
MYSAFSAVRLCLMCTGYLLAKHIPTNLMWYSDPLLIYYLLCWLRSCICTLGGVLPALCRV